MRISPFPARVINKEILSRAAYQSAIDSILARLVRIGLQPTTVKNLMRIT
jgi:hypothetical protein